MAPVHIYELHLVRDAGDFVIDPVCRMQLHTAAAAGRLRHRSIEYWFCSLRCAEKFAAAPELFV